MIMRLFVPCSSCMNLLELEGTLSNYIRRVLTNQYAHLFTNSYKQLEQLAIQHCISRNTKLLQKPYYMAQGNQ